jgi:hypothetical protein
MVIRKTGETRQQPNDRSSIESKQAKNGDGSRPHSSICRHSILAGMGKADELAKKWGQ